MSDENFMDTEAPIQKVQTSFVRYFIQHTEPDNEEVKFFTGTNAANQSKWDINFERAFLFNHLPRKYEIENIIQSTSKLIKSYETMEIKKVTFTLKDINSVDLIL